MQKARQQAPPRLLTSICLISIVATCQGGVGSPNSEGLALLPDISSDGACKADLVRHHCIADKALGVLYALQGQRGSAAISADSPTAKQQQQPKPHVQPEQQGTGKSGQQRSQKIKPAAASAQQANAGVKPATAAADIIKQRALLTDATRAAAASQQEVEIASLQLLKTQSNLSFPVDNPEQLLKGPRKAKCLRDALMHSGMGSFYGGEALSADCLKEVMAYYDQLATDSTRDYQLLASCAEDIITHCSATTPNQLMVCLSQSKHLLKRNCAAAVGTRISRSAGISTWDQDLAVNCMNDARLLCSEDVESDLKFPSVGGFTMGCLREQLQAVLTRGVEVAAGGGGKGQDDSGQQLSKACVQAMFRRQMVESEDVRFSYPVSRLCASELRLHCSGITAGQGELYSCLETHLQHWELGEECQSAVAAVEESRAADARLDWRLRNYCRKDIRALCSSTQEYVGGLRPQLMLDDWEAPPGAGVNVTMCLRHHWISITSNPCKRHVRHLAAAAFRNTLLDAPLLRACHGYIQQHCMEPGSALVCLKGLLANGLKLAGQCMDVLHERLLEAADNFDLLPELSEACKSERRLFCGDLGAGDGAVLDCLADFKEDEQFGDHCRDALTGQFILAVSDIRLMTSLQDSCAAASTKLCPGVKPGSGRVIECLQQHSAEVSSSGCRKQLMRLRGFAAHDYRLDYNLRQACSEDVAQLCGHVVPGEGRVHACLRANEAKLAASCKAEVHEAEAREHQELALNPAIKKSCKTTITRLCGQLSSSVTNLVPCLQKHMPESSFPDDCRQALTAALARQGKKYHLQTALHKACDTEVERLCPEVKLAHLAGHEQAAAAAAAAADSVGSAARVDRAVLQVVSDNHIRTRHMLQRIAASDSVVDASTSGSSTSSSTSDADSAELLCISQHLGQLSPGCRSEVASEVHRQLMVYLPGMPLTAACDADAKMLCKAGSADVSAFLQAGSLISCLAVNTDKLSAGCWGLVSMFDKRELQHAKQLAAGTEQTTWPSSPEQRQIAGVGTQHDIVDGTDSIREDSNINSDPASVTNVVRERVTEELHSQLNDMNLHTEIRNYVASVTQSTESFGFLYGVLATVLGIAVAAGCLVAARGGALFRSGQRLRAGVGMMVVKDGNV